MSIHDGTPGRYMPAECHGPDAEANARLIAAAPDLLAACEAVHREIDQTYDGTAAPRLSVREWEMVIAAIAKAKGGAA